MERLIMKRSYKEEELFAAVLALPAPERLQYLERAGADVTALSARLQSLHEASEDAAAFMSERSGDTGGRLDRIGAYRIIKELGEGGCGVAYLAEQTAPVKRQVALKVIKAGMDTRAVIARFEAERQVLAMMDHPHVAKVFDAGATSAGRPYFAMELVRGIKITDYCGQSRLTIRERLTLFVQVCQAIQHAHLKGIIHRDIKPSNVLVTRHGAESVAKVIDFGISKPLHGRPSDATAPTVMNQLVGTPAYLSPEQASPGSGDIDTRTDVYGLGALLYELLTGCAPFDASRLQTDDLARMRQRILTEEPPTPSKLSKQVPRELDWIVMRCLEKEPARRYQTANDLILDLHRYLHHEPVLARAPSLVYVVRKFAQRRRMMFAASLAGIAFVVFAAAFAAVTLSKAQRIAAERQRAQEEAARAENVSEFMLQIFDAAQPLTSGGHEVSAREVLDEAGRRIRGDLQQHPEVRARLLEAIGRAYRRMNLHVKAIHYLEDAQHIREQLPDPAGTKMISTLIDLSIALLTIGELERAERVLQQGLAIARERNSERTETYARLVLNLGRVQLVAGDLAAARKTLEQSLSLYRDLLGHEHPEVGTVLRQLATVLLWQDEFAIAERASREARTIFNATRPALHPDRVAADAQLADSLLLLGQADEAAPLLESALVGQTRLFGADSKEVGYILSSLGRIKRQQGRLEEAEDFARRALRAHEAELGSNHSGAGGYRTSLALILVWRGKYHEAEELTRRALSDFAGKLPPDHAYVAAAEYVLGEALLAAGRADEAEAVLRISMDRWKRSDSPQWRIARSQNALGQALLQLGRKDDAEHHLLESYRLLAVDHRADKEARTIAKERIVQLYSGERDSRKRSKLLAGNTPATSR